MQSGRNAHCGASFFARLIAPSSRHTHCAEQGRDPLLPAGPVHRAGFAAGLLRFCRQDRGATLVEMALTLPIMMVLTLAMLGFGLTMNNYILLNQATSSGARLLAESAGITTDPCANTISAVAASAPNLNAANLKYSFTFNTGSSTYSYSGGNTLSCAAAASYLIPAQWVSLTVTYPCNLTVYGVNYASSCVLTSNLAEVVQ